MAKTAGQLGYSSLINHDRSEIIRKNARLRFTEKELTAKRRKSSRNYFKNAALTVTGSLVAMPITGGASVFVLIPACVALFESSLHVISSHVDIP
tara:strand:+ start:263 stop:547 length:285 start_codon:yes stop_codon:yes gene_type:complete